MRPLVLTSGDPAGIGPDITLLAWARERLRLPPFCLTGDAELLRQRAQMLGLEVSIEVISSAPQAADSFLHALPVLHQPLSHPCTPGQADAAHGDAVIRSIETAVSLVMSGDCAAVVTNPISKASLYRQGFSWPGHTEFLAHLAHQHTGLAISPVMMIWSEILSVIPATIHIPLAQVASRLDMDLLVILIQVADADLKRRFGLTRPRFAVCGLNPHAGEDGLLGDEEIRIIRPALALLRDKDIDVAGPFPADTLFHEAARSSYDVVVGMYHDQVLAPVKALAFDRAVNVTLGLPFVRTSPDHGTAFSLAGTGQARPDSLIEALRLAGRLAGGYVA